MRSAALRVVLCAILAACGLAASSAVARGQDLDPIATVTSVVSTILSQTTVVDDPTEPVSGAGATDGSSLTDVLSGTGGALGAGSGSEASAPSGEEGGSSSGPRSARRSEPGTPRTRFDRLPRRYEVLLERIEFGHNLKANIARLRALLAAASPELRARVLRLLRMEIRRLEQGGVTARERPALRRLRTLLALAREWSAKGGTTTALTAFSLTRVAGLGPGPLSSGSTDPVPSAAPLRVFRGENGGRADEGEEKSLPAFPGGVPDSALETHWWFVVGAMMVGLALLLAGSRSQWPRVGRGTAVAAGPSGMAVIGVVLTGIAVGIAAAILPLLF
jgi:hypothetical protein